MLPRVAGDVVDNLPVLAEGVAEGVHGAAGAELAHVEVVRAAGPAAQVQPLRVREEPHGLPELLALPGAEGCGLERAKFGGHNELNLRVVPPNSGRSILGCIEAGLCK